jgi:putative transcriptional regulator
MSSTIRKGSFLVATPALADPNFAGSVVLVCEHSPEGTMGLIVNRPLAVKLAEILPPDLVPPGASAKVHQGGPVKNDHLLFLHGFPKPGLDAHPVCDGVFLGGDTELLKQALAAAQAPVFLRCYLGYAGWGSGQLEAEMAGGAWLLKPAQAKDVFSIDLETLWTRLVGQQAGAKSDPSAPPQGPELN